MYEKTTWLPRLGTGLNKFANSGTTQHLELTPEPDAITQEGTPFAADLMNNIENGVHKAHMLAGGVVTVPARASSVRAGAVVDIPDGMVHGWAQRLSVWEAYYLSKDTSLPRVDPHVPLLLDDDHFASIICNRVVVASVRAHMEIVAAAYSTDKSIRALSACTLSDGRFCILYSSNPSSSPTTTYVICGKLENGVLSFGPPVQVESGFSFSTVMNHAIVRTGDKLQVFYCDKASPYYVKLKTCTVNELEVVVSTSAVTVSNTGSEHYCPIKISDEKIMLIFTNGSGAIVATECTFSDGNYVSYQMHTLKSVICASLWADLSGDTLVVAYTIENDESAIHLASFNISTYAQISEISTALVGGGYIPGLCNMGEGRMLLCDHQNGTRYAAYINVSPLSVVKTMEYADIAKAITRPLKVMDSCAIVQRYAYTSDNSYAIISLLDPRGIALNNANYMEDVHVAFDGNVELDGVRAGDKIETDGVKAYSYADGYLNIKGYWKE